MGDGVKEGLFVNDVLKFLVPNADILTKALPRELFQSHREFVLGMT